MLLSVLPYASFALSWDGDSAGGSTDAVNGSSTGYVIRSTDDSNCVVGYRFSVVDSSGNMKVTKVIDVYRNTSNGDNAYLTSAKFSTKYNKKQMIKNKSEKLTTTYNQTNCYKEKDMDFITALPNPATIEAWQTYETNINKVLSKLGVGSVSNMNNGDKVIVEPLFDICLAGEYQALTVSEIAYCGRSVLGGSSTGGTSSTSDSWGFIANYTNRIWPNKLYTPDGQGLWGAATPVGSSSKISFDTILTKGYGAGIAYNQKSDSSLSGITYTIKFDGNGATGGSTESMSMTYDVAKALTANGFTKTSYKFAGWNTKANGTGINYADKQYVKNLTSTDGAVIILYAKWEYDINLAVDECDVYSGSKNDKSKLFGVSKGNVFDDYVYKTDYPTIGDTIWYNIHFPTETEDIKVRQYVKYNGGSWATRDVTLSSSNTSSQWFPVQFTGDYKTITEGQQCFEIQAKTDWIDASGNVKKSGTIKTFYIPIKPVVYRTEVDAYDYEGKVVAFSGRAGSSGKLYSGQNIRIAYKYTADNDWLSTEYLRGSIYNYNGSKWTTVYPDNDGYDAAKNKVGISKSTPVTLNSAIGTYTVPVTSQSKLRFKLDTWWSSDKSNTIEDTWYALPVVKPDVALTKITLVDHSTKSPVNVDNLEAGKFVTVRYTYQNNTDVKVYVEGFNSDKTQIDGVYVIPAKSSIVVEGDSFTVPNKRDISIWGGVYLEGAGIYNTEYETVGSNNTATLKCKVKHPLTLQPIKPNADYRENTEVITSYWLKNSYTDDYTPDDEVSVKINIYNGSTLLKSYNRKQVVVPGVQNNIVYFKWKVPIGLNGADVTITGEILDDGKSYSKVTAQYTTTPQITSLTPDTQFEKKGPANYEIPSVPSVRGRACKWWEWTYTNGEFVKKQYYIGCASKTAQIIPININIAKKQGNIWHMKSGYGIKLMFPNGADVKEEEYDVPPANSYTLPQTGEAYFPEYNYSVDNGKITTLKLSSNLWIFENNGSYGNVHFTPLWYPDGKYTIRIKLSDLWTPSGMMYKEYNSTYINIEDAVYDDWYIGR